MYSVVAGMLALVGNTFPFTWKIENGKWHHKGTLKLGAAKQEVNEIWEPVP